MDEHFKITDNKIISLSRIPSDLHRLGLPQEITKLLIDSGVFFMSQIEQMTEYALSQITGINSITAESIKRSFYQYQWRADQNGKIQTIKELKSLIEKSPRKIQILQTRIEELFLHNNIYLAFRSMKLSTIQDVLQLNEFHIFRIQGISTKRYDEIMDSIFNLMVSIGENRTDLDNFQIQHLLNNNCYTNSQLAFPEVFTMLLNTFTPRNRAILSFLPVPGLGETSFAEGSNWANYLDSRYLIGKKWDDKWDPEGLLSTFPAIGTCLLGVFAALLLKNQSISDKKKAYALIGGGILFVIMGYLWGLQFPIIKKIWTSSYVLVAGGYSSILMGIFYLVIDVWKVKKWLLPFIWIGANAITIYMARNFFDFDGLARRFVGGDIQTALGEKWGFLLLTAVSFALTLLSVRFLYQKKIFLRV